MSVTARTRPYWPGRRMLPGFGNTPASRIAPVFRIDLAVRDEESAFLRIDVCRRPAPAPVRAR